MNLRAAVPDYDPKYWSPTEEVVSPHVKWAKPDAQGPLRVLFIVNRWGMREVVELAQRMEMQYTVFPVSISDSFAADPAWKFDTDRAHDKETLTADLAEKLEKSYDLIVIGNVQWTILPLTIQAKLLKKVKEGVPLIGFLANSNDDFKQATAKKEKLDLQALIPYKGLPAFAGYKDTATWLDATVDYSVFGKGKILTLKGFQLPPGSHALQVQQVLTPLPIANNSLRPKLVEYDYYLAWIIHLMRFATGRMKTRITGHDYVCASRSNPPLMEYFLAGPANKKVTCEFILRNDDNQIMASRKKETSLSSDKTPVSFEIPRVSAGRYFADVWVKEGEKVLTFGSSFVKLTGDPAIEAIDMRKDFRRDEKVTGKIKIKSLKDADGLVLACSLEDTYGRRTAEARMDLPSVRSNSTREVNFELAGSPSITILQNLNLELWKENELLDQKVQTFSISDLPLKDDIRLIGWQRSNRSYPIYQLFSELAKAGLDTQYGPAPEYFTEVPFLFNMRHLPYAVRIFDRKSDGYKPPDVPTRTRNDHVRLPCLNDPEYRKQLAADLTKCAEQHLPFSSSSEFSMGDECHFAAGDYELCFCPACTAFFHKFLEKEYQTVQAMNLEYGTQYAAFDEVRPITMNEAKKDIKLQPLWADFRRCMEDCWTGIFSYCDETIKKTAPGAGIGYEGSGELIRSPLVTDYYKIMQVMRLNNPYNPGGFVPQAFADFACPGTLLGLSWYGGYNSQRCAEFQRYFTWRVLFMGANSYWVYNNNPSAIESTVAPDLSFYDFFRATLAELEEIRKGTGKLLMHAGRTDAETAILYSAPSVHASTLTENFPKMEQVLNTMLPLFEDAHVRFRIISREQLAGGELERGPFRVLWLPYVQALSRKEAAKIEAFVSNGGTAIADLRPGVRDEHGKPYEKGGVLDSMFGVKQETKTPAATNSDLKIDWQGLSKTFKQMPCDWSIEIEAGRANGLLCQMPTLEKPALIVNTYGKGRTMLLNFSLAQCYAEYKPATGVRIKTSDGAQDALELFKKLMTKAGTKNHAEIEPKIDGVRFYWFGENESYYLGVLQELPEETRAYITGQARPLNANPVILNLYGKKHVYDARLGKYLGYTDQIKIEIEPAKAMLFALLPYKTKGIKLNLNTRMRRGAKLEYNAEVEIDGTEKPGLHVLHVELISPKGEILPHYSENTLAANGKTSGYIALALNDEPGKWKMRVRDVATGITTEKTFRIK